MSSADISATITELSSTTDQKTKLERYKAVLQEYVAKVAIPQLLAFVQHLVSEDVQLAVSRQVLLGLAQSISGLPPDQLKEVGLFTLEKVGPRVVSFEEQVSMIREELANVYEKEEDWTKAAAMLAGIPLDSGIRVLDDNYKVEKYIKIAQLYLEDDEPVSAETFINRASLLINEETEPSLRLLHKVGSNAAEWRWGRWEGASRVRQCVARWVGCARGRCPWRGANSSLPPRAPRPARFGAR